MCNGALGHLEIIDAAEDIASRDRLFDSNLEVRKECS